MRLSASLAEYVAIDDEIHARAAEIAKLVIECEHWVIESIDIPIVRGYPAAVTAQYADIVIGRQGDGDNPVMVRCPSRVFERGSLTEVRDWVNSENDAKLKELDNNMEMRRQAQRSNELAILKELIMRYPAEADLIATGGENV